MEKYIDEDILVKREVLKKNKYKSIKDGYYVGGKIIHFSENRIMNPFSMFLADNMGVMPIEFAKIKYPSEFRPNIIFTTLDLSVNLGFSLFHRKLENDELESVCRRIMSALKRDHNDYRFYGIHQMSKITGYRFSFRSHAMDNDLYNIMLIAQLEKHSLMGNFNCLYKDYEQWEKMIVLMWETICPVMEGEN